MMMYLPRTFGSAFNDTYGWLDDLGRSFFAKKAPQIVPFDKPFMRTDVREKENSYELEIDLPGYKKENLNLELDNGYLTITAAKEETKEENDENGKLIRQERAVGSVSRSFFVGDELREEDIRARFADGVLSLSVPKKVERELPEKKAIVIE